MSEDKTIAKFDKNLNDVVFGISLGEGKLEIES